MRKYSLAIIFCLCACLAGIAQTKLDLKDSTETRVHPSYDNVSHIHRELFGENYRKEWAAVTKMPLIKISEISGGLVPTELGGGHQSHSLRLEDKNGKEWVLRGIEKYSEGLAPEILKGSIFEKWLDDNFSAQHPYSALLVPVLADAIKVPHTNPVIGVVAADKSLGKYAKEFEGTVCLLEEREPEGESDNTPKMLEKLDEDNDNKLDSAVFFRARLLDLLIADWGRHEDQWRWVDKKKGDGKEYLVVPRDRDQVLYVNEGLLPKTASGVSMLSFLEGFNADYKDVNAFFINGGKLNQQFLNQYSYDEWMQMTQDFVSALPDDVLMRAVNQLPSSSLILKKDIIFLKLKGRRDHMLEAMDTYYRFLYAVVDIRTSDKSEFIEFTEGTNGGINLRIHKLSRSGSREQLLFSAVFQPDITKEIRLFTGKGDDVSKINVPSSNIKIRIIGGEGQKDYDLRSAKTKVDVYENLDNDKFKDPFHRFSKHLSADTLNTQKVFSDLYGNSSGIVPAVNLRSLDGFFFGVGYRIKKPGFRKAPYSSVQKISGMKSIGSGAFMFKYDAEWMSVFKNTDIAVNGLADINGNIHNFFGRGNDTFFDQAEGYRTFYRVNFTYYQVDAAFRVHLPGKVTLSAGPAFQQFVFNPNNNTGRYINNPAAISQYDNLQQDKTHAGFIFSINKDLRDNKILPTKGFNMNLFIQGFSGLNKYSDSYTQIFPQLSFYRSLDPKGKIVFANRTGAGFTFGKTAFYQSAFLGSQDNLLGFRKFRFAGDNVLYNNSEARISLPNFLRYLLPGTIGLIGFYDAGRVWIKNEHSSAIHHGYGGGVFLSPFNRLFIRAVAGFSNEGMQPTVSLKQRF